MWWLVVTPEFSYTEPIMDDGSGPAYDVRDCIEVKAPSKREAVRVGVGLMLDVYGFSYCPDRRSEGLCPYTGVVAVRTEAHDAR